MTAKQDEIRDQAAALLQAGRAAEAEPLLRALLVENPHHTDGLQLMGVLLMRSNNLPEAEKYFSASIAADAEHWPARANIALIYLKTDRAQEAFEHAEIATRLAPDHPMPWRRLADAAEKTSQFDTGCTALTRLSDLGAADANLELRCALHGMLSFQFDKAHAAIERAIAKGAPDAQVRSVVSELAVKQGNWAGLKKIAAEWLSAEPSSRKARELASRAENELGNSELAVELYRPLIENQTDISAGDAVAFGRICLNAQLLEDAGFYLAQAIRMVPDNPHALTSLARLRTFEGEFEEAKKLCLKAIDLDPDYIRAYLQLSVVMRGNVEKPHQERMKALYEARVHDVTLQSALAFALGDIAFRRQQAEEALDYYTRGNEQRAEEGHVRGLSYIRDIAVRDVSLLEDLAPYLADLDIEAPPSDLPAPIFITGLPRSGTTLFERIIGAHPEVTAIGERAHGPRVLESVLRRTLRDGPAETATWISENAPALRQQYLDGLTVETGVYTDKMPGNALGIPLFAALFPQARFILTFRRPYDVAVSLFRHQFAFPYSWAHRFEDIADYAPVYMAAAARFVRQQADRATVVNYDELVADKAMNFPLLIKAAGLEWHENCADPGMSDRKIQTFSSVQVRSEISARSSDGGALFRPLMEDYADELDHAVTEAVNSAS